MSMEAIHSPVLQGVLTSLIKYNPGHTRTDFNFDFSNPDSYFIVARSVCKAWKNCFDELVKFSLLLQNGDSGNVFESDSRVKVKRILQKNFVVHLIDEIAGEYQLDLKENKADTLYDQIFLIKEVFVEGIVSYRVRLNAVNWACESGHTGIGMLLLNDPRVDPTVDNNLFMRSVSEKGHTKTVSVLLQDERVDPAALESLALKRACDNGHTKTVKLLLQDGRSDPAALESLALKYACDNGHTKIVKLLLQDGRSDPAAHENVALIRACENGHAETVRVLLQDPRVVIDLAAYDTSIFLLQALVMACSKGHAETVRVVLQDGRLDPSALKGHALVQACLGGHTETVKVLLQDPRVDASRGNVVFILLTLAEMLGSRLDFEVESAKLQFSKLSVETRNRVYGKLYPLIQEPLQGYYPGCAEDAFHDLANLSSTLEQKSQAIREAAWYVAYDGYN